MDAGRPCPSSRKQPHRPLRPLQQCQTTEKWNRGKAGVSSHILTLAITGKVPFTTADETLPRLYDGFANDCEVCLMCRQPQHDQVSIHPVETMLPIWVVTGAGALSSNVLHDLVLALTRHKSIREYHVNIAPSYSRDLMSTADESQGEYRYQDLIATVGRRNASSPLTAAP